jgi:thermitase
MKYRFIREYSGGSHVHHDSLHYYKKRLWGYGIVLFFFITALFHPVQAGTAPMLENISAGGPAVPMGEAGSSDGVARLYVSTSRNARVGVVSERIAGWGDVVESEALAELGVIVLEVPSENLEEQMKHIRNTSGVRYVETEQYVFATDVIPNDPAFIGQYALKSIRASQGWMYSTGEPSIVIAIIDSGVHATHPDLQVKLVGGYDFVDGDATPQDGFGHGTHVAGIAAAATNNGTGMAGVSWGARIMPVRVLNNSGEGTFTNVALGIQWAVDNGAHVINLSLGGAGYSAVLESAVQYAYDNNVLLVASAGNAGCSNCVLYPAKFPQVVAVGASNISDTPANFSNSGPEVELAAPGDTIYSTLPGGYGFRTGTSMSAPHVSGLAAILLGYVSGADSVRGIMQATARDIGPAGWDDYSGAGLIQMDAALAMVAPPLPTPTATPIPTDTTIPPLLLEEEDQAKGTSRLPAFAPPLVMPSPTLTFTPLPAGTPASPTETNSPRIADATPTSTQTAALAPSPTPSHRAERLKVFLSPMFCGAVGMILSGLWLFWLARKRKKRFHNKIVM